jgi:hypothetical protein
VQELSELLDNLPGIRSDGRGQLRCGFNCRQPMPQLVDLRMKATYKAPDFEDSL